MALAVAPVVVPLRPVHLRATEDRQVTSYKDPIVEEVRAVRASLFAKHGGTVGGLFKHLREVQETSGRTYVSYPAKRIEPQSERAEHTLGRRTSC